MTLSKCLKLTRVSKMTNGTLLDLITEQISSKSKAVRGQSKIDFDYLSREGISKSDVPEYHGNIKEYMNNLENLQGQLRRKAAIKSDRTLDFIASKVEFLRESFSKDYKRSTVDDLVVQQIGIMKSLNGEVGGAIEHATHEAEHLQEYGTYVLAQFETAKTSMQETNVKYGAALQQLTDLENLLSETKMEAPEFTARKSSHDNVNREINDLWNKREIYALRTEFKIAEREEITAKEDIVRATLYELERMTDYLGMFLENSEQTFGSTTLIQTSYETADALRRSHAVLSEIAHSRSIIGHASVKRFAEASEGITYEFPHDALAENLAQSRAVQPGKASKFDEVHQMLTKTIIKKEPSNGHKDYATVNELLQETEVI